MKTREPAEEDPEKDQSQSQLRPGEGFIWVGRSGCTGLRKLSSRNDSPLCEEEVPERAGAGSAF